MLELINELRSKEDSFRGYVQSEVLIILSKIIASRKTSKIKKKILIYIESEIAELPFDYRNIHLGNQTSHNEINSYIKIALYVLDSKI